MSNKINYLCSYRGYDICKRDKQYLVTMMTEARIHVMFTSPNKGACYDYIDTQYADREEYR